MTRFRKSFKIVAILFVSVFIAGFIVMRYEKYLDKNLLNIETYSSEIGKEYGFDIRDKGDVFLKNAAYRDELIIFGSSELASDVPQNIKNMFPNTELNCNVNIIGKAYTQSLINTMRVGALGESLKGRKLVIIVSLQWFLQWLPMLYDEIDINGFNSNFSELQFYDFMNNSNISQETKIGVCKRVKKLSGGEPSLQRTNIFADLYSENNFVSDALLSILKPYYNLRYRLLHIRDKHQALKNLRKYKNIGQNVVRPIDWDKEDKLAERMGKETCVNNDFYVYDEYYNTYIKPQLSTLENSYVNVDLTKSKEWNDYELFLKTCKDLGINPYFIIVPTNGFYYDYLGLDKEKRMHFYDKLESMAKSYGFDYLDMRQKEYEPYFFKDIMHLGWKGWLYVSKKITEYYA